MELNTLCAIPVAAFMAPAVIIPFAAPLIPKPPPTILPRLSLRTLRLSSSDKYAASNLSFISSNKFIASIHGSKHKLL